MKNCRRKRLPTPSALNLAWVVACVLLLANGCRRNTPTPVAAQPVGTTPPAVSAAPPTATTESPTSTAISEVHARIAEEKTELPIPPPVSTERILLLAPTNPLIIELQLSIDGQPHTAALENLIADVLKLADTDGDGRVLWKELCASPRVKYGQYGSLAIDDDNDEKQVIERYDIARDGIVDRTELPRFLTRNAGSSRPFSIRGTLDHRDQNRRGAPTWRVIDADEDGIITATERAVSPARLASRDNDDDEILLVSDLNPRLQAADPEMMADRRRRGPDAARLLGPHADWSNVLRVLEQTYGGDRVLRPDSFPLTPELFTQLDKNNDGRIKRDEIVLLNTLPAHVIIAVAFGKAQEAEVVTEEPVVADDESEKPEANQRRNQPTLKLVHIDMALATSYQPAIELPGRLTLALGDALLTFYANDTVASDDFSVRAKQALDMYDQNKDGYLEKSEVPESLQGQFARFEAVDPDGDGKAYPYEIEAFLAQQQAGLRAQIHARATDREDVLFAALDADHDERLDSRELEGAPARLAAQDKNADGELTSDELPEVLLIGLARGSLENADATFAPPPVIARGPNTKAPRWFTAMDANQDGAISRREFLGSLENFRDLDKDANGLLDVEEVAPKGNEIISTAR
jgi:hypothetical protein